MVKLLDFGIAKETGEERMVKGETTTTGQLLGSPHYMSPEQARGQDLDGRSDLWSLAVILFRALTGRRPFDGDDVGDLIVRICMDPIPPVTKFQPILGAAADAFFAQAFQRDPNDRFQNAREFANAFESALAGVAAAQRDDSGSWDRLSNAGRYADEDGDVTQMTPSSGSERFANIVGPYPPSNPEARSSIGFDTFAATTAPRQKRRRIVGGLLAALVVGGFVAFFALNSSEETRAAAPDTTTTPVSRPAAAPEPSPGPTAEVTVEPSATAALSASTAKSAKPKPIARRRARPGPRPQTRPAPRPTPGPAPKPTPKPTPKENKLGY